MTLSRPLLSSLSHPLSVLAVAVLLLNDHVLKGAWPSWTTGKLSDVAGLVFFPLLLAALIQLVLPRSTSVSRPLIMVCIVITAMVFAAVQVVPAAADGYRLVMGALQLPVRWMLDPTARLMPVVLTPDPTDLLALPALAVAWRIATANLQTGRTTLSAPIGAHEHGAEEEQHGR